MTDHANASHVVWHGIETRNSNVRLETKCATLKFHGRYFQRGNLLKFQRLYSDAEGESHWRDVEVALEERVFAPPAQKIEVSEPESVTQMMFLRLRSGWDEPIHPTPVRQKLICLAGSVRVTASDGEVRDINCGDVWCMEDNHGKGHHTAVTSKEDFVSVIVQHG